MRHWHRWGPSWIGLLGMEGIAACRSGGCLEQLGYRKKPKPRAFWPWVLVPCSRLFLSLPWNCGSGMGYRERIAGFTSEWEFPIEGVPY